MSFTLADVTWLSASVNPQIAGFSSLGITGTGMRLLFHIGSGPNGVFGVELLQLLEKHISELVRFLCVESVQQFLPLALSKLMTEIVELIASQEVLLLDLLQCNMELLDF